MYLGYVKLISTMCSSNEGDCSSLIAFAYKVVKIICQLEIEGVMLHPGQYTSPLAIFRRVIDVYIMFLGEIMGKFLGGIPGKTPGNVPRKVTENVLWSKTVQA